MTKDYTKYLAAVAAAGAYYSLAQASASSDDQEVQRSTEMEKQAEAFWENSELPTEDRRQPPPWIPPMPPPPF
jgi:hypothetical protein